MNLYKIWQEINNDYDTFDSAIVSANTEQEAKEIDPSGAVGLFIHKSAYWVDQPDLVKVEYIGTYHKDVSEVVLSSFNAR